MAFNVYDCILELLVKEYYPVVHEYSSSDLKNNPSCGEKSPYQV